jgi:hypothetical protein
VAGVIVGARLGLTRTSRRKWAISSFTLDGTDRVPKIQAISAKSWVMQRMALMVTRIPG